MCGDGLLIEIRPGGICGTDSYIMESADKEPFKSMVPVALGLMGALLGYVLEKLGRHGKT